MNGLPTEEGFYWAKWRIAEENTFKDDEQFNMRYNGWEVVEVWQNGINPGEDEFFFASVPGVAKSQPLENFHWHLVRLVPPPDVKPLPKAEFIVGRRGGDWYGFANCRRASEYIRRSGVQASTDATALVMRLEQAGFTVKKEGA